MMHVLKAGLMVLVMTVGAASAHAEGEAWVGDYTVDGTNPDGSTYDGTVSIWQTGSTYQVEWIIGDQVFNGTAIEIGDVLSVGYDGGIAVYGAADKGTLLGQWSPIGGDLLGTEVLSVLTSGHGSDI